MLKGGQHALRRLPARASRGPPNQRYTAAAAAAVGSSFSFGVGAPETSLGCPPQNRGIHMTCGDWIVNTDLANALQDSNTSKATCLLPDMLLSGDGEDDDDGG